MQWSRSVDWAAAGGILASCLLASITREVWPACMGMQAAKLLQST